MKMAEDLLRERLAKYIPPKEEWTPVDEALYGVEDIYNVPDDKVKKLRENAIRYSFKHHYEGNKFYHEYCKDRGVKPDDIKSEEDFKKIPLIPDTFFKSYPDIEENGGKGFLEWLEKIYTGKFPKIELNKKKPDYDDVIEELAKKNVYLIFSSSTTGRFSFMPRDWLSYSRAVFSTTVSIKKVGFEYFDFSADNISIILFSPNPSKTYNTARVGIIGFTDYLYREAEKWYMIDRPFTTKLLEIALGRTKGIKGKVIKKIADFSQKKIISDSIKYFKKCENERKKLIVVGYPYMLHLIMSEMEEKGIKFHFNDGGAMFGGGWKTAKGGNLSPEEFRNRMGENFGIAEENCRDAGGMTEISTNFWECKGHYKHIPYFFYPIVLDEEMNPLPYGEYGRFANLDPLADSYPGFIVSSDKYKLLEHCPVCGRTGIVVGAEISRMPGAEPKGCAAAMAKVISEMGE
jgi:hypothetical protein